MRGAGLGHRQKQQPFLPRASAAIFVAAEHGSTEPSESALHTDTGNDCTLTSASRTDTIRKASSAGSWEGNLTDPKPVSTNRTWRWTPSSKTPRRHHPLGLCSRLCSGPHRCLFVFPGPPQPRSLPPAPLPHSFLHPPHKGPAAPQRRAHKEPKRACNLVIVTLILPFPLFSHPHLSPIRTGRRLSAGEQMTLFMHTGSRAASWAGLGWRSPADPWRPQPSGSRSSERRPGAKPSPRRPKGSAAPQRPHTAPGRHRPRLEARPRAPRRRHLGAVPRCHTQSGPPGGERGASVPHPNPSPSAR